MAVVEYIASAFETLETLPRLPCESCNRRCSLIGRSVDVIGYSIGLGIPSMNDRYITLAGARCGRCTSTCRRVTAWSIDNSFLAPAWPMKVGRADRTICKDVDLPSKCQPGPDSKSGLTLSLRAGYALQKYFWYGLSATS